MTGGGVRYGTVEFHSEGKNCEGKPRRIMKASAGPAQGQITIAYENAAVTGIDNISEELQEVIKKAFRELSHYRQNGATTLLLPIDVEKHPEFVDKMVTKLNDQGRRELWDYHDIGSNDIAILLQKAIVRRVLPPGALRSSEPPPQRTDLVRHCAW